MKPSIKSESEKVAKSIANDPEKQILYSFTKKDTKIHGDKEVAKPKSLLDFIRSRTNASRVDTVKDSINDLEFLKEINEKEKSAVNESHLSMLFQKLVVLEYLCSFFALQSKLFLLK